MTQRADQLFMQEQLKDLQITELAFPHCPALLGDRLETPDQDQYDFTQEDTKDDEGDTTSQMDIEFDASTGEEMDASGQSHRSLSADRFHQRNHTPA